MLAASASGVAPGAMPRPSISGWKPDEVVIHPSTAHIETRQCLSSDSRKYATFSASLVKPNGSKKPRGAETPTMSFTATMLTAERAGARSAGPEKASAVEQSANIIME